MPRDARLGFGRGPALFSLIACVLLHSCGGGSTQAHRAPENREDDPVTSRAESASGPMVIIWHRGSAQELEAGQRLADEVRSQCEGLLRSADDRLWEVVTEEALARARNGLAVEIRYGKMHKVVVPSSENPEEIDGFLLPLKPVHGDTIVIYLHRHGFLAGPLIASRGRIVVERLAERLAGAGFSDRE
jgi:hypothetical protein